jgi:hypothetical protein
MAGLVAGLIRTRIYHSTLNITNLRFAWLVPVAFIPQLFVFQLPATRSFASEDLVGIALISSQVALLAFVWINRRKATIWVLGLGLILNLMVIILNGGLMPMTPDTVHAMVPEAPSGAWQLGTRFGTGKDVVLPADEARLWWLSDRFVLPSWFPYPAAFSVGDVFIAFGAFWLLWSMGEKVKT